MTEQQSEELMSAEEMCEAAVWQVLEHDYAVLNRGRSLTVEAVGWRGVLRRLCHLVCFWRWPRFWQIEAALDRLSRFGETQLRRAFRFEIDQGKIAEATEEARESVVREISTLVDGARRVTH